MLSASRIALSGQKIGVCRRRFTYSLSAGVVCSGVVVGTPTPINSGMGGAFNSRVSNLQQCVRLVLRSTRLPATRDAQLLSRRRRTCRRGCRTVRRAAHAGRQAGPEPGLTDCLRNVAEGDAQCSAPAQTGENEERKMTSRATAWGSSHKLPLIA